MSWGTDALTDDVLGQAGLMRRRPAPAPALRSSFAGFRFPPEVIMLAVRWYLRYGLSYHPFPDCQAVYWMDYGRALARIRGRHDDAVMALLRAEKISPRRVHRNPLAREVIAGLLARSRRDFPDGSGAAENGVSGRSAGIAHSRVTSASADIRF